MGKHKDKIDATLERRQKATPNNVPGSKFFFHKPGSQNRKKGFSKKVTR